MFIHLKNVEIMHRTVKPILFIAASLILSLSAYAGTDKSTERKSEASHAVAQIENVAAVALTGTIIDEQSNETLAGVSILVDGKKYYSDLDGNFAIADVKPGKYRLTVELISYEPISVDVDLVYDESVQIGLQQK